MVQDKQEEVYKEIFLKSIPVILQMELTGMPLNISKVHSLQMKYARKLNNLSTAIQKFPLIQSFTKQLQQEEMVIKNLLLKEKVKPITDFADICFNPQSTKHLRKFLYETHRLPQKDYTKTGLPGTGNKTLQKLIIELIYQNNFTKDELEANLSTINQIQQKDKNRGIALEITHILQHLIDRANLQIIQQNFIKAFISNSYNQSNLGTVHYLYGSFKLGGTVSGRMSSASPNLQNLPSTGTIYAKDIKSCFEAPSGWLMAGADFSSLEDRVSALTTKDKNKLAVYEHGFDGHCLKAYAYYKDLMPDINKDSVDSINSIETKYPELRQKSKGPTFALTYGGTYHALMNQCGLSEDEAKRIENSYHELYNESDDWVQNKLMQASKDGYVTGAFGLRLRTPILKQIVLDKHSTPYEARSEARTAGNMLGQSYGLLNNRAAIEFRNRVLKSPYRCDIKPISHVHDSQYFIIKNEVAIVEWFNRNLVECMEWQELPELKHNTVKLGGNVEIYYPTWSDKHILPNKATKAQILEICSKAAKTD
jgi:DNA polymerase-1